MQFRLTDKGRVLCCTKPEYSCSFCKAINSLYFSEDINKLVCSTCFEKVRPRSGTEAIFWNIDKVEYYGEEDQL